MVAAGVSNCGKRISSSIYSNKKLSLILLSFLLIATLITTVSTISASRKNASHPTKSTTHTLLRSSCSSTRYPDLCFSSLAAAPSLSTSLATLKDVIEASLNITITAVDHAYFKIQKLIQWKGLSSREKTALHDCLEDVDQTLDELQTVEADLRKYPKTKSLSRHADDLKTLLSAAMTNQDSCIDGFSHDRADRKLRKELFKSLTRVHRLCSNALAMVRNMTDTDMANERTTRRLGEAVNGDGFPSWLSAGDRRLLQASTVTPNVVVAADGSGDFTTVSAAVTAAPESSSSRYVIKIKAGVYRENVEVPKKKTNLMFIGDGRTNTIITGSRNVVDGSTTFQSATVAMSTKKNNVFNAVMDDEMLTLLQEQIEMGKKGDRGFKEEAYNAVASAMTESSNGAYVMTSSSVKNRYKHLKQLFYAMKEMMNASGFGYDPVSKRVIADDALWNTWLEGHPTARPLKTKSIDYEKMGLVCGNDMATGQFARSSSSAPSIDLMQESSNYSNSDDAPIHVDDLEFDSRGGGTSGESSSKKKEVRKRARDVEVLVTGMKESAALVQHALDNLADSIKNSEPHKRIGDEVYRELVKIEGLTQDDIDVTHEWLTLRKEMAAVFLSHGDKKEWILRRLHRIHASSFP